MPDAKPPITHRHRFRHHYHQILKAIIGQTLSRDETANQIKSSILNEMLRIDEKERLKFAN